MERSEEVPKEIDKPQTMISHAVWPWSLAKKNQLFKSQEKYFQVRTSFTIKARFGERKH